MIHLYKYRQKYLQYQSQGNRLHCAQHFLPVPVPLQQQVGTVSYLLSNLLSNALQENIKYSTGRTPIIVKVKILTGTYEQLKDTMKETTLFFNVNFNNSYHFLRIYYHENL